MIKFKFLNFVLKCKNLTELLLLYYKASRDPTKMVPTPNFVASSLLSGLNTYLVLGAAAAGLAFDVLRRGTVLRRLIGALTTGALTTDDGGEPAGRLT